MPFLKTTFIAAMLCENCKALEPSKSGLWDNFRTAGWYAGCTYGERAVIKNEIVPEGNAGGYWNRFYLENFLKWTGITLVPTGRKLYADCYDYRDRRE